MKKILIIDTSILCVYLKVPDMDDCGSDVDKWDYCRVSQKIDDEIQDNSTLVLPMATLIETGNHVAHANGNRFDVALKLSEIIIKVANEEEPWAAFTFQRKLWDEDGLVKLANSWPILAAQGISIGDATIKDVAEYYAQSGYNVEILTGDAGLKSYQPVSRDIPVPRRRR
ncbi:MAG: hypothetical protein PWP24_66 [Clostridiales bacterium]|nr:hypothetical protein [Clostridiales bacterium]